jgi:hypothetical protein
VTDRRTGERAAWPNPRGAMLRRKRAAESAASAGVAARETERSGQPASGAQRGKARKQNGLSLEEAVFGSGARGDSASAATLVRRTSKQAARMGQAQLLVACLVSPSMLARCPCRYHADVFSRTAHRGRSVGVRAQLAHHLHECMFLSALGMHRTRTSGKCNPLQSLQACTWPLRSLQQRTLL